MITNNVYGAPPDRSASGALQEALNRLATIDAENLRLRQQLFENRGKHDDLDICYRTLEAELKYAGKKDVEKVEKELNIRNRDHAALLKDHTGLLKQLAALKQQHFLQQKELQESQQKSIADAKKNKVDQYVGAANGRYGHSQVASITGSASDQRDYTKQRPPSRDEKSNLSDQSVSLPMSLSTQQSKQEYCEGSVSSTASVSIGDRVQKNSSAAQVALPRNISGESDTFRSRVVESEIKIPDARTRTLSTAIIEKKIVIDVLTQQINHSALIVLPPPVVAVAVPLAAIRPAEVKHGSSSSSSSSSSSQVNSLRSSALLPIYQDFLMSISLLPHALHGRTRNINSRVSSRSSTVEIDTSWSGATPLRSVQRNFNVLVREQQNYSTTVAADRMQGRLSVELVSSLCVFAHFLLSESSGKVVLGRDGKYFLTASAGIYIPLKRSQDGENRGREEIKGLSNSLLRCLSLLEGVLDYMTPQTVAAVRRARLSSTEPPSTDISNSNVCGRNSIAVDGVGERIKTQVDLNETFNKVASVGVADTNRKMPRERIESADLGAGTSTSESARLGLKFPPLGKSLEFVSLKEADSYPVNTTIPKDPRGSTLYRGLSVSGRGHGSGMKSNVTFAENSQSTPILGGSDRSVSGDESAPPSTSTAYDCGVTVQKRARIRGPVGSDSPATCCSVMPSFSLSSLIMPAVSQTNLRAVYNSITSFSSLTNGVLDAAQPSRDSTESSPDDELSVANRCWADLPGEIVKLLDGVITLIKSLGTLDPSSECDFSDSSDGLIPDLIRRLTERTVGILNKAYQGDGIISSICSSVDLEELLTPTATPHAWHGDNGCEERISSPLTALFSFPSYSSYSPSANQIPPSSSSSRLPGNQTILVDSDDCTDDMQVLERDALAGRITILKTAHEQQLVTECELLSIMQSILRSRNAFRLFVSDKFTGVHIKNRQSTGGSKWFIGRLCRRLLLCVPEEIEERVDTSFGFVSGQAFAAGFDIVRIKISVVRFLIGLVEGHGVEGVAAIFGVSRLSQYMLTNSDASRAKDFPGDRIGEEEFGDALRGNGSGGDNEGGSGGGSVDLSGVHCITLCWMLATRTLDIHSSALSPKGLLLADLVEVCGRLLDLIVGHVDTQKWSEVDDEIIIRQMSKRTSHDVHPALQKQLKNNPFSNLW